MAAPPTEPFARIGASVNDLAQSAQQVLACVPPKFAAVAGTAALAYWVDQQLLLTNDLHKFGRLGLALLATKRLSRDNALVCDLFEASVRKWPHKACMRFEDRTLSFSECDAMANRIAHWAMQRGLRAGQTVGLLMENRPEYITVWLGLSKIGVVTALLNTHLQADGLVHCIQLADTNEIIVGAELLDKAAAVESRVHGTSFHVLNDAIPPPSFASYPFAQSLDAQLTSMSAAQPPSSIRRDLKTTDIALLIYTSGTTGLPKAARVSHISVLLRSLSFVYTMHLQELDRIYCALPLYHTSGGNLAVGMMVASGATLCISRRFSTTKFWDEVRQFDATIVQYIGEMCRYLLNAPSKTKDRQNHVRAAFGNGLRPDVWATFQSRFGIPAVYEFYGSTEGILGMINSCTTPADQGHLGRRGVIVNKVSGTAIVQFDVDADDHVRDPATGFLRPCRVNEVGELLCKVDDRDATKQFHGYYKNERESQKKVLRGVFTKHDAYFRTGDLFRVDANSCWHFVDRIGDTFRWKGENVATNEVSEAISHFPGLSDICVYGVQVPGHDGRACCAAMVFDDATFELPAFATFVQQRLSTYAVPLFLRQLQAMAVTGTMKHEKAKMRADGMDPTRVRDKLWFLNKATHAYERLTVENYHDVVTTSRL